MCDARDRAVMRPSEGIMGLMNEGALLRKRLESFESFRKWRETEDPDRFVSPEAGLRWAGEMLDFMIGRGVALREPDGYEGIRIMHERLARLPKAPRRCL